MSNAQVSLPLNLWKTQGCHEFLSSIGFDVMGIGKTDVKLRSGKLNSRKTLQCALRVVKDIFSKIFSSLNLIKFIYLIDRGFFIGFL